MLIYIERETANSKCVCAMVHLLLGEFHKESVLLRDKIRVALTRGSLLLSRLVLVRQTKRLWDARLVHLIDTFNLTSVKQKD